MNTPDQNPLRAFLDHIDGLTPGEQADAIASRCAEQGGTFGTDAGLGDFAIYCDGMHIRRKTMSEAVRIWRLMARSRAGGFDADNPADGSQIARREWAEWAIEYADALIRDHVLQNAAHLVLVHSHDHALRTRAALILNQMEADA